MKKLLNDRKFPILTTFSSLILYFGLAFIIIEAGADSYKQALTSLLHSPITILMPIIFPLVLGALLAIVLAKPSQLITIYKNVLYGTNLTVIAISGTIYIGIISSMGGTKKHAQTGEAVVVEADR